MRRFIASVGCLAAAAAPSHAAPREDALRADFVRGLIEVCLPAQAKGISARDYVDDKERALTLRRVRFSNTTKPDAWNLSPDRRAYLFSDEALCYVSAEVRTTGEQGLVTDLHADLLAISAVEPAVTGDLAGSSFAAGYCAQLKDGRLASFNMISNVSGMEPGLGRVAPGQRRTVVVSAPLVSECGAPAKGD